MKVSIIIPTYNRANFIGITIQSFLELNYPKNDYEIIIVDNNSIDNTKEVVSEHLKNKFNVRVIYIFESRQGVHYARNTAAKHASFDILYFTDDDMIADPNLLSGIKDIFDFDNKVAVATGRVLPKWEYEPPQWIVRHCYNYLLSLLDPEYEFVITFSLPYLYSCHQAIKRDVFFKVEGFNPEYTKNKYMGDGETGLNTKIKALGYKFGYNGRSIIYHIIPKSRFTQKYLNNRLGNNGVAHSYSAFKANPTIKFLLIQLVKKIFYLLPVDILKSIMFPLIQRDLSLYRFFISKFFYYYNSILFDLRILSNLKLRRFVLKKDWLSNDNEFDTIKI